MQVELLYPGGVGPVDIDERARLLDLYRPPSASWLRLNLIASVTGAAAGSDGTSETLSNRTDRRILGIIRELADVVLIGAESVRSEGYTQPKRSRIAIVTASGDLAGNRIGVSEGPPPIVICPPDAVGRVRETVADPQLLVVSPGSPEDGNSHAIAPEQIVSALRAIGLDSIVCEGGPSLAAQLVDAGLVDEFCLATSPRIGGTPFPLLGSSTVVERGVTLTQLLRDESSGLYARWRITG